VPVRAIPGARHPEPHSDGYLTEDPGATWVSLQGLPKTAEHAHLWPGTVWVGRHPRGVDATGALDDWGEHGGWVGTFALFGDERLIRQIQEVCR
jgi:hypothetical protein